NMALLLRWLHPDIDREGERAMMARRVAIAWDTLKSPERRARYDRSSKQAALQSSRRGRSPGTKSARPAARSRHVRLRDGAPRRRALDRMRQWLLGWLTTGRQRRKPFT